MSEIDPIEYGKLLSKVELMGDKINAMDTDIKALLELANKSKGGGPGSTKCACTGF